MTRGRYSISLIFIAIGVLFLLSNLGILQVWTSVRTFWPSIFIVIGLANLFSGSGRNNTSGYIFLVIGVILQAQKLGWINWQWHLYWPVIFVFIGLWLLLRPRSRSWWPGNTVATDTFESFTLLSGTHRVIQSANFQKGEVTTILGGAQIDLRSARTEAKEVRIDVTVLFGGLELNVPADWRVETHVTPILGGAEDKHRPAPAAAGPILHVNGFVMFGGIEIKN